MFGVHGSTDLLVLDKNSILTLFKCCQLCNRPSNSLILKNLGKSRRINQLEANAIGPKRQLHLEQLFCFGWKNCQAAGCTR